MFDSPAASHLRAIRRPVVEPNGRAFWILYNHSGSYASANKYCAKVLLSWFIRLTRVSFFFSCYQNVHGIRNTWGPFFLLCLFDCCFFLKRVQFGSLKVRFYWDLNAEYACKQVLWFLFISGQPVMADLIFIFEDRTFYLLSVIY